jgi:hypothetical protein
MTLPTARVPLLGLAVLVPLALARLAQAAPRHHTLDPVASKLTIHVAKRGVLGFAGHKHEVVAGTFDGTATFDPDRMARSTVDVTFDAGALHVSGKGEPAGEVPTGPPGGLIARFISNSDEFWPPKKPTAG